MTKKRLEVLCMWLEISCMWFIIVMTMAIPVSIMLGVILNQN